MYDTLSWKNGRSKNKWILVFLFAIFIFLLYPSFATANPCAIPSSGEPVVHVWPSGDGKCTDLRAAVESANSYSGSGIPKIIVHQGSYFLRPEEDILNSRREGYVGIYRACEWNRVNDGYKPTHGLVIRRPVEISAAEASGRRDKVLIDFMGATRGIIILSDDVHIDGLMLTNNTRSYCDGGTEALVYVYDGKNVMLTNNTIFNGTQHGIFVASHGYVDDATKKPSAYADVNVTSNFFKDNVYSDIEAMSFVSINITGNVFYGNGKDNEGNYSVVLFGPVFAGIRDNMFYNGNVGIMIHRKGAEIPVSHGSDEKVQLRASAYILGNTFLHMNGGIMVEEGDNNAHRGGPVVSYIYRKSIGKIALTPPVYNFDWDSSNADFFDEPRGGGNRFKDSGANCFWWMKFYDINDNGNHWKVVKCWVDGQNKCYVSNDGTNAHLREVGDGNYFCPSTDEDIDAPQLPDLSYPSESSTPPATTPPTTGHPGSGRRNRPISPPRIEEMLMDGNKIKLRLIHNGDFGTHHAEATDGRGPALPGAKIEVFLKTGNKIRKIIFSMEGAMPGTEYHIPSDGSIGRKVSNDNGVYVEESGDSSYVVFDTAAAGLTAEDMSDAYIQAFAFFESNGRKTDKRWTRRFPLSPVDYSLDIGYSWFPAAFSSLSSSSKLRIEVSEVGSGVDIKQVALAIDADGDGSVKTSGDRSVFGNCNNGICHVGNDYGFILCSDSERGNECMENSRSESFEQHLSHDSTSYIPESGSFKAVLVIKYVKGGSSDIRTYTIGRWYMASGSESAMAINVGGMKSIGIPLHDIGGKKWPTAAFFTKKRVSKALVACGTDLSESTTEVPQNDLRKAYIWYYVSDSNGNSRMSLIMSYFPALTDPGGFAIGVMDSDGNPYEASDDTKCYLYLEGDDVRQFEKRFSGYMLLGRPRDYTVRVNDNRRGKCDGFNIYEALGLTYSQSGGRYSYSISFRDLPGKKVSDLEGNGLEGRVFYIVPGSRRSEVCTVSYSNPGASQHRLCSPTVEGKIHVYPSGDNSCTDVLGAISIANENGYDVVIHPGTYVLSSDHSRMEITKPISIYGVGRRGKVELKFISGTNKFVGFDINLENPDNRVEFRNINFSFEGSVPSKYARGRPLFNVMKGNLSLSMVNFKVPHNIVINVSGDEDDKPLAIVRGSKFFASTSRNREYSVFASVSGHGSLALKLSEMHGSSSPYSAIDASGHATVNITNSRFENFTHGTISNGNVVTTSVLSLIDQSRAKITNSVFSKNYGPAISLEGNSKAWVFSSDFSQPAEEYELEKSKNVFSPPYIRITGSSSANISGSTFSGSLENGMATKYTKSGIVMASGGVVAIDGDVVSRNVFRNLKYIIYQKGGTVVFNKNTAQYGSSGSIAYNKPDFGELGLYQFYVKYAQDPVVLNITDSKFSGINSSVVGAVTDENPNLQDVLKKVNITVKNSVFENINSSTLVLELGKIVVSRNLFNHIPSEVLSIGRLDCGNHPCPAVSASVSRNVFNKTSMVKASDSGSYTHLEFSPAVSAKHGTMRIENNVFNSTILPLYIMKNGNNVRMRVFGNNLFRKTGSCEKIDDAVYCLPDSTIISSVILRYHVDGNAGNYDENSCEQAFDEIGISANSMKSNIFDCDGSDGEDACTRSDGVSTAPACWIDDSDGHTHIIATPDDFWK